MRLMRNCAFASFLFAVVFVVDVPAVETRGECADTEYCAYYVQDECPLPNTCHFTFNWDQSQAQGLCEEFCGYCDWGGEVNTSGDCGWICQCEQ